MEEIKTKEQLQEEKETYEEEQEEKDHQLRPLTLKEEEEKQ